MKLPHRRQFLHLAAGAAALPAVSRIARAQAYPTRPVRIIVVSMANSQILAKRIAPPKKNGRLPAPPRRMLSAAFLRV
jgi:hypothetical protein